jgi:hypothetical protein
MLASLAKAQLAEPVDEVRAGGVINRELEKLVADVRWRGGRLIEFADRLLCGFKQRAGLFLEEQQRAMAVRGGDGGRRGAKAVVENFE